MVNGRSISCPKGKLLIRLFCRVSRVVCPGCGIVTPRPDIGVIKPSMAVVDCHSLGLESETAVSVFTPYIIIAWAWYSFPLIMKEFREYAATAPEGYATDRPIWPYRIVRRWCILTGPRSHSCRSWVDETLRGSELACSRDASKLGCPIYTCYRIGISAWFHDEIAIETYSRTD